MIHAEKLTKYYGDFCAVDEIDFSIDTGEVVGLLGPNGAGKTTTMRMLTGFLTPSRGRIDVKDMTYDDNPLAVKRMFGYLPESAPLYHDMLAYDYLEYVARIRGLKDIEKISRIKALADLCGLRPVMHKAINTLSKGYKQRVGLAHAMMADPEILVLDEPTSGLDPNQIIEIREIIREIGREKTVILSTHILSEAEATCDRVLIINKGRIAADGKLADLKQEAGARATVKLGVQGPEPDALIKALASLETVETVTAAATDDMVSAEVNPRPGHDPRGDIYRCIRETDWVLLEMRQSAQSLETIFRELTREG